MSVGPHVLEAPASPLDDKRVTDIAPGNPVENLQELVNTPGDAIVEPEPVSEAIISSAKEIGFDDTDLAGLDQASIERMIAAVDRRAIDAISRFEKQQGPPAPAGVTGAAPAGSQPPAGAPVPQGFKLNLDDSYDEGLVQALNQMNQFYAQQMAAMRNEMIQSLQSQPQSANVDDDPLTRWFDGQFSGLGEEYHSVFGKGSIDDTRPGSSEENNRLELHRAFSALKKAYPTAKDDVLFQRALRASFGNVGEDAAKRKLAAQARQRSQSTIGRPSGRKSLNVERDPITGVSTTTIDEIQREIDSRLNR